MRKVYIYTLTDPTTGRVGYVGRDKKQHLTTAGYKWKYNNY